MTFRNVIYFTIQHNTFYRPRHECSVRDKDYLLKLRSVITQISDVLFFGLRESFGAREAKWGLVKNFSNIGSETNSNERLTSTSLFGLMDFAR